MAGWNPWHGCHKISSGCLNCYVYRSDNRYGKDSSIVTKNSTFDLPIRKNKNGEYKIKASTDYVYTCFTSDFFLEDADMWRPDLWEIMKIRTDLNFIFITKRIHRIYDCIPDDWQDGYDNVTICSTVENQEMADYRLPILLEAPIKHKHIICEPLLGKIDLSPYLNSSIENVVAGGESGLTARVCDYSWVLAIQQQCKQANINFHFKQTGANFIKDGRIYKIARKHQHLQARKAGINVYNRTKSKQ